MGAVAKIQLASDDCAELSGDLTFDTVKKLSIEAAAMLGANNSVKQLDLSEVERVDSSGLALLLEWQAGAKKRGALFQVVHAPADLVSLAKLCEAQELLQLESRSSDNPSH
jgi:phospholipid transport system transporter-binding protein